MQQPLEHLFKYEEGRYNMFLIMGAAIEHLLRPKAFLFFFFFFFGLLCQFNNYRSYKASDSKTKTHETTAIIFTLLDEQ